MSEISRRDLPMVLRAAEGEEGVLIGVVTTYDSPYPIGGGFREQIAPGAFDASLEENPVIPVYHQHNHRNGMAPIGVAEKAIGPDGALTMRATLFLEDSSEARAVYRAVKAGALREWSVGMTYGGPESGDVIYNRDSKTITVQRGGLVEISSVLKGAANGTTTLDVRSLAGAEESEPAPVEFPGSNEELAQLLLDIVN